jgi:predicted metal-dependent hydrolase
MHHQQKPTGEDSDLLKAIDAFIGSESDPSRREQLQNLRTEAQQQVDSHLEELRRLRDEAHADTKKLKSRLWVQRVVFLLKEMLDLFDFSP